jgi:hypothetical protein
VIGVISVFFIVVSIVSFCLKTQPDMRVPLIRNVTVQTANQTLAWTLEKYQVRVADMSNDSRLLDDLACRPMPTRPSSTSSASATRGSPSKSSCDSSHVPTNSSFCAPGLSAKS